MSVPFLNSVDRHGSPGMSAQQHHEANRCSECSPQWVASCCSRVRCSAADNSTRRTLQCLLETALAYRAVSPPNGFTQPRPQLSVRQTQTTKNRRNSVCHRSNYADFFTSILRQFYDARNGPESLAQKSCGALSVVTQSTQGPELLVQKII